LKNFFPQISGFIPGGEIHIHLLWTKTFLLADGERNFLPLLPAAERETYQRLGGESRRREFIASRLLVRGLFSAYLEREMNDLEFLKGDHGKPYLKDSPLEFNLSHTEGLVACCFGLHPVGIDVEKMDLAVWPRDRWEPLAERFFSAGERKYLFSQEEQNQTTSFFRIFTLKEAYVKCRGYGLSRELNRLTVPLPPAERTSCGEFEFFSPAVGPGEYGLALVTDRATTDALSYRIVEWDGISILAGLSQEPDMRAKPRWPPEAPSLGKSFGPKADALFFSRFPKRKDGSVFQP
jgi:phosphopantetheinyl transferase